MYAEERRERGREKETEPTVLHSGFPHWKVYSNLPAGRCIIEVSGKASVPFVVSHKAIKIRAIVQSSGGFCSALLVKAEREKGA